MYVFLEFLSSSAFIRAAPLSFTEIGVAASPRFLCKIFCCRSLSCTHSHHIPSPVDPIFADLLCMSPRFYWTIREQKQILKIFTKTRKVRKGRQCNERRFVAQPDSLPVLFLSALAFRGKFIRSESLGVPSGVSLDIFTARVFAFKVFVVYGMQS